MLLQEMKLVKSDNSVIRSMLFHEGVNFVVDEEKSGTHNHVGKTTTLKLIDIALGSRDKKYIYTDSETNSKNSKLEELVNKEKISVELTVSDKLINPNNVKKLKVDLYRGGHKFIDNVQMNAVDYNLSLNDILFNNSNNEPSFRSLIPSFVRVSAKKDNYDFLKNLHQTTTKLKYRSIYNYLFDISDSKNNIRLEKLTRQLNQLKKTEQQYRDFGNNDQSTEVLKQLIDANKTTETSLQLKIKDIISGTDFVKDRNKISNYRKTYQNLEDTLSQLKYQMHLIDEDISQIENEQSTNIESSLTNELFSEVINLIPRVDKTYNDLIKFNNALSKNKIDYLKNVKKDLLVQIENVEEKQKIFLKENENLVGLIKNNDISKYDSLNDELTTARQNISKLEETLNTLNNFGDKRKRLKIEIKEINEQNKSAISSYKSNLKLFNSYFTPLVHSISGGSPMIAYHENNNEFPLSVEELNEGTSTGTLKTLVLCYDISYQKFANEINKSIPNFIVHDILENIEGETLAKIIQEINLSNNQVIIGILREKLQSSKISEEIQNEHQLVSLSNTDRLFEPEVKDIIPNTTIEPEKEELHFFRKAI